MTQTLPRGIRNNNPGNLRRSINDWRGMSPEQTDKDFFLFVTPVWGIRALMITLLTYYRRYGLDTIQAIINRYAPPCENDSISYQNQVSGALGVSSVDTIKVENPDTLLKLAKAIVRHECGKPPAGYPDSWYAPDVYKSALDMALERK